MAGEKKRKSTRLNDVQLEHLVNYMLANRDFAIGKLAQTGEKKCYSTEWKQLSEDLNSLGPKKDKWEQWRDSWRDIKYKVKKKAADKEAHGDGGEDWLSWENKVLQILGLEHNPLTETTIKSSYSDVMDSEEEVIPCTSYEQEVDGMITWQDPTKSENEHSENPNSQRGFKRCREGKILITSIDSYSKSLQPLEQDAHEHQLQLLQLILQELQSQTKLKEKEVELREKALALKEKDVAVREKEVAVREKEVALREKNFETLQEVLRATVVSFREAHKDAMNNLQISLGLLKETEDFDSHLT